MIFGLYLLTLAPSTAMWDTSEYIAAAYVLGIPHPPGNPFFVLIGRVFAMLPLGANVAMRINVLAASASALSAGFWFLVTERVLVSWLAHRWQRIAGGAIAALHRRDGVHGLEPERRQREGLHGLALLLRDSSLADGALVRRAGRAEGGPRC